MIVEETLRIDVSDLFRKLSKLDLNSTYGKFGGSSGKSFIIPNLTADLIASGKKIVYVSMENDIDSNWATKLNVS